MFAIDSLPFLHGSRMVLVWFSRGSHVVLAACSTAYRSLIFQPVLPQIAPDCLGLPWIALDCPGLPRIFSPGASPFNPPFLAPADYGPEFI